MGDRANIRLIQPNNTGSIYIYSHWSGYEMPTILKDALGKARGRWGDNQYFNRILIDQITKDGRDEETGWGIGLSIGDNSYNILAVDERKKQVSVQTGEGETLRTLTFEEFLALENPQEWRDA